MHIITTTRAKTETVQGDGKKILKLGMKAEQRDGYEYELTVALDVVHDNHVAVPTKDRTKLFNPDGEQITKETGERILAWLNDGKSQEEALLEAFQEAIGRIGDTHDIAELGIIYTQFKGTEYEQKIIAECASKKAQLVQPQGAPS